MKDAGCSVQEIGRFSPDSNHGFRPLSFILPMKPGSSLNVRGRLRAPHWQGVALLFVVLGVALAAWVEVLPRLVKPARPISNANERLSTELAHLKMLGRALRLHAAEHDGKFPPAISEIHWRQNMPGMDWNGLPAAASRFHSPDDGHPVEWLYYQGKSESDPPETILAASPVAVGPKKDRRLVVRASGVAEIIPEIDFHPATDPVAP